MGGESEPHQPDDREPSPERQAELRAAYEANVAAGKAPYDRVAIRARGELLWIMRERNWSGASGAEDDECADLRGAKLDNANLSQLRLIKANLSGADLWSATVRGADLTGADLSGARLGFADLSFTSFYWANLNRASFFMATLRGANLHAARMNAETDLAYAKIDGRTRLVDVVWNGAPVTRLNWGEVDRLGDELDTGQAKDGEGKPKRKSRRRFDVENAVLANRQVATLLRDQGLNEHADRFAYRAQVLQRRVLRLQRRRFRAAFSWFLDALAGHGYKPERSLVAYVIAIVGFGIAYFALGQTVGPPLSPLGAFVFSMTSFHGRGFFPGGIGLDDPITVLAAFEAFIGLVIEVSFIATFTQRFFAR